MRSSSPLEPRRFRVAEAIYAASALLATASIASALPLAHTGAVAPTVRYVKADMRRIASTVAEQPYPDCATCAAHQINSVSYIGIILDYATVIPSSTPTSRLGNGFNMEQTCFPSRIATPSDFPAFLHPVIRALLRLASAIFKILANNVWLTVALLLVHETTCARKRLFYCGILVQL